MVENRLTSIMYPPAPMSSKYSREGQDRGPCRHRHSSVNDLKAVKDATPCATATSTHGFSKSLACNT